MRLILSEWLFFGKMWKNMEKRPFFRAAMARLGKYRMGGYGRIGVYRVKGIMLYSEHHFKGIMLYSEHRFTGIMLYSEYHFKGIMLYIFRTSLCRTSSLAVSVME